MAGLCSNNVLFVLLASICAAGSSIKVGVVLFGTWNAFAPRAFSLISLNHFLTPIHLKQGATCAIDLVELTGLRTEPQWQIAVLLVFVATYLPSSQGTLQTNGGFNDGSVERPPPHLRKLSSVQK